MSTTEFDSAAASGIAGLQIEKDDESNGNGGFTELQLSELERQILDLYDRLEELQLDISLLNAENPTPDVVEGVTEEDLQAEQQALLEAKARYALRKSITESILVANPILKAVHAGSNASPIERDLLPLIQQRDDVSTQLTDTAAKVLTAKEALTAAEAERVVLSRKNTELAATMMALAERADRQKKGNITDPEMLKKIDELEKDLKTSRQRWRLMKGTASGVVAGSGMDWARDEKLSALVLEDDSEEE